MLYTSLTVVSMFVRLHEASTHFDIDFSVFQILKRLAWLRMKSRMLIFYKQTISDKEATIPSTTIVILEWSACWWMVALTSQHTTSNFINLSFTTCRHLVSTHMLAWLGCLPALDEYANTRTVSGLRWAWTYRISLLYCEWFLILNTAFCWFLLGAVLPNI